ncbi:ABC transporter permease [Chloroflexi bacterium TSY]|nr:ABC transporter permease [Chloroflexi bacterium TSY]
MFAFVVKRLVIFIPMIVVVSIVSFVLIQAPPGNFLDDYINQLRAQGEQVDLAEIENLKRRYGLDQPMYVQYWKWMRGVVQWDFGVSIEWRKPINQLIGQRLMLTLLLGVFTILFTWTLAIPIGILSAVRQYSWLDYIFTFLSYIGVGTPNFLLALVLMWVAFSNFGLKITGLFSDEYIMAPWSFAKFWDMLKHIWVPMVILGTDGTARFTRIMRANLLDELNKPYVETARAKGLTESQVVLKYPTRIALNPFISTVGWALPQLFSGSLIVATVLSLPTVGPLLLRALLSQDMYLAGSIVLILSVLTLIGTLISDILLAITDPRIRVQG